MKKILDQARRKPESVRRQIALLSALAVTGIIIVVWVISLKNNFSQARQTVRTQEAGAESSADAPFSLFFNSLKNAVNISNEDVDPLQQSLTSTDSEYLNINF